MLHGQLRRVAVACSGTNGGRAMGLVCVNGRLWMRIAAGLVIALVVGGIATGVAWSQVGNDDSTEASPEPTTGSGFVPLGVAPAVKDPFTPYGVGDPNDVVPYEQLTGLEKASADVGRLDAPGEAHWDQVHAAFGDAVAARAQAATASAAGATLNVEVNQGVVP